jgi:CRP/FNR family transcriptional regulator, cyclic AMP receptor protein
METLEGLIAEHPFFKGMEMPHLKLLVSCASNVRFEPGQFVFREGAEANQFYLIRHGRVTLEIHAPPRGSIIIQTLGEGDVLGWSWLFPPYRWKFSAKAIESTRAIALDGKCLRGKSEEDHDLGYELQKRFARVIQERLQATRLQLINVYEVGK